MSVTVVAPAGAGAGNELAVSDDAFVVFTPSGRRGRFPHGTDLLAAARALGVDLDSVCGGRGLCGRCQVVLGEGEFAKHGITSTAAHLSPVGETEERCRDRRKIAVERRLGCQARLLGDVVVDVPAEAQQPYLPTFHIVVLHDDPNGNRQPVCATNPIRSYGGNIRGGG